MEVMCFGDEAEVNRVPCIALWGTFCIHVDGEVGICCMDSQIRVPLGNVVEQSIEEIWKGERLARLREMHLNGLRSRLPMCDGCTLWREGKKALSEYI